MLDNTVMTRDTINSLTEKYSNTLMTSRISRSVEAAYSAQKCRSLCLDSSKLGEEYKSLADEVIEKYENN